MIVLSQTLAKRATFMKSIQNIIVATNHKLERNFNQLPELISSTILHGILDQCEAWEDRYRDLPADLMIWLCISMCWLPQYSIQSVLKRLLEVSTLFVPLDQIHLPSRSAISQARYRLGAVPLASLFREVCKPLATNDMSWAFYQDLRLVALDITIETVADTPANAHYFGRSSNQYNDGAYPSYRAAYLCECGTHAIFDAAIGTYKTADTHLAWRLLRSVTDKMLVMLDAGLISFDFVNRIVQQGGQVLAPAHPQAKFKPIKVLSDGTYLAWMKPTTRSRDRHHPPVLVRVLCYQIVDPNSPHHYQSRRLITTLLDPNLYPARDLISLYHQRWEIEITIDEIDTHQHLPSQPARSLKPVGVIQEFYATLLAHYFVRTTMLQTACLYQLDPDRLSFTFSLQCLRDAIPYFQLFDQSHHSYLQRWVMTWIAQVILPPRQLRWNPRVIKRQRVKFPRKCSRHLRPPKPTRSFYDSIVLT
jgi:hypothetical protein